MNLGHLLTREAELNPGHKFNPFCALEAVFNKDLLVEEGRSGCLRRGWRWACGPWSVRSCFLVEQHPSTNSVACADLLLLVLGLSRQPGKEPGASQGALCLLSWQLLPRVG